MPTFAWYRKTLALVTILSVLAGLAALTICVSVAPLARWTQDTGACWGADRIDRDVREGPTVLGRPNSAGSGVVRTTTFALSCRFGDEVRLVENDEAVLMGFLVSFLIGAVPCAALVLLRRIAAVSSRPSAASSPVWP